MKWTSLPDAAANEAKKRAAANAAATSTTTATTPEKKILNGIPQEGKEDVLAKKLAELRVKAEEAQRALALVGASPEAKQASEITEKYNMFLTEHGALLAKLTPQKRDFAQAEARSYITTRVALEALTKYREEMDELSKSSANSIEEHLAMAEAVGKSAKAMQDATVKARVNKEFQKYGDNWQADPERAADAVKRTIAIRAELDAKNTQSDRVTADGQARELAGQERINDAILRGSDAREAAALETSKAAIRADFANRGDTDTSAMQAQLDAVEKLSEATRLQGDLERAAGMNSTLRYQEEKKAIQDATLAAIQYGKAIDYREVLAANKEEWLQYQAAQDKATLATGSMMDGLKVALGQLARDTQSAAQQMHDAFMQAIGALNDSIAKLMTGQKANFGQAFQSIAESLAKTALQKGESALLGAAGLGKPDGSQNNPLFVKMVGSANYQGSGGMNELGGLLSGLTGAGTGTGGSQGGGGGFGGFLGTALGLAAKVFLPGFADGTDAMIPGMASIVGEKGPEIFVPPSAGAIVPNSALKNGIGGGHQFHIDARGSTDPAQTVALIHQYMLKAGPQIANSAIKQVSENNLRTAPSTRR